MKGCGQEVGVVKYDETIGTGRNVLSTVGMVGRGRGFGGCGQGEGVVKDVDAISTVKERLVLVGL